ncbi:MAG TPA: bacteriohemerythrin [Geothrix sp.]|nr:bacteriohemerythrin [Geothrix sp.]
MAFLAWHKRYSLGDAEIDAQHQKLFEFVNGFDDVIPMGMTDELSRILDDLIAFTVAHFTYEEARFREAGFPKADEHEQMHRELLLQVRDLRSRMKVGGHVGAKSIVHFLADWLTSHIMREDMEFKPYLAKRPDP